MKDPHENYIQSLSVAATLRYVWCFPATLEFSTYLVQLLVPVSHGVEVRKAWHIS